MYRIRLRWKSIKWKQDGILQPFYLIFLKMWQNCLQSNKNTKHCIPFIIINTYWLTVNILTLKSWKETSELTTQKLKCQSDTNSQTSSSTRKLLTHTQILFAFSHGHWGWGYLSKIKYSCPNRINQGNSRLSNHWIERLLTPYGFVCEQKVSQ